MQEVKTPKLDPTLKTILYVLRDDGGCGYYRCALPAQYLRKHGLMNAITDLRVTNQKHIDQADIVVFQEIGSTSALEAFRYAQSQKKAVVVEVDDLLHMVSPNNPGYSAWNPATLFIHRATEKMKKAFAMTVSTAQLARDYAPYNENIYVLPNFLPQDKWDQPIVKRNDGTIRIGWAGGNSHFDDLKMMVPVLEKIIKEYDGKVRFEMMGMNKHELKGIFDRFEHFIDECSKCNYKGELMAWEGQPLNDYPTVLATHGWDIAIAPVVDTAFNNAKSDLKLKEYGALQIPVVASKVTPYEDAKKAGCSVVLAENFKEWYTSLKELIDSPEKRAQMVQENTDWVEKNWMDDNIQTFSDVYHQIIENNSLKK